MNFPEAFLTRTKAVLGDDFDSFIQAMDEEPVTSVRLNMSRFGVVSDYVATKSKSLTCIFAKQSFVFNTDVVRDYAERVPWASNAYYLKERPSFTFDPLFHAGCYYVQEASSMFLEQILKGFKSLNDLPIRCLDLCAAPGGKSTHLSSLLPEGSLLIANEVIRSRSYILSENLTKWGNPYTIVSNNDPEVIGNSLPDFFDLIVADVPCSGEGMFRKDKNAVSEWSLSNVNLCAERQQRIIADIWPALKPGGVLVYSTCTFNLEENEENIHWIIKTFNAIPLDIPLQQDWNITRAKKYDYSVFRFIPGKTKGEGFFIAALQKPEVSGENREQRVKNKDKRQKAKDKTIIPQQINDWITDFESFSIHANNNIISAFPKKYESEYLEVKNALRIIHAGITIGEIKGKDIIPDHSLAMSVNFNPKAFPLVEVDKETAINYLRRESIQLPPQTPKGYVVLTFQNQPIGFVKNIGNRANNLYPQEWRIRKS
ncbi:MAG: rRNA cytosine-C5-methyltransferase [Dysgonamonadaceae bacterium]|nr:rRNA cytosine-C5-methyltransferase [Dysgonamonadaceae bacterium]